MVEDNDGSPMILPAYYDRALVKLYAGLLQTGLERGWASQLNNN